MNQKIESIIVYLPSTITTIIGLIILHTISQAKQFIPNDNVLTWMLLSAIITIIGILWFDIKMEIRLHGIKDNTTRKE